MGGSARSVRLNGGTADYFQNGLLAFRVFLPSNHIKFLRCETFGVEFCYRHRVMLWRCFVFR
jgi:hypothetical protein